MHKTGTQSAYILPSFHNFLVNAGPHLVEKREFKMADEPKEIKLSGFMKRMQTIVGVHAKMQHKQRTMLSHTILDLGLQGNCATSSATHVLQMDVFLHYKKNFRFYEIK